MKDKSISKIVFERMKKGAEYVAEKGGELRDKAIRGSEKFARKQGLKLDIDSVQDKKKKKLKQLSYLVYNLFTKNQITHPEIAAICEEIRTLQWQIDEKRTEIDMIKKGQGEYSDSEDAL